MKTLALALGLAAVSTTAALAATDIRSLDANGDRFATFAEATGAVPGLTKADFRDIDLNRDNRLSSVELQSAEAQTVFSRYVVTGAGVAQFSAVDTNGDNFVSFTELAGAYPGLSANDWNEVGGRDDNRVSSTEYYGEEARVVLARSSGDVTDLVALNAVDADGSRFASFAELNAAFPGLSDIDFGDIDQNSDNRISFSELNDIETRTILGRAQQ